MRPSGLIACMLLGCAPVARGPLEVEVVGATAIEHTQHGARWWFDAPAEPWVRAPAAATFTWSGAGEVAAAERRGRLVRLARPAAAGPAKLIVRTSTAERSLDLVFREPPEFPRLAELAQADLPAAWLALDAVAATEWPWACVSLARATPPEDRAAAYLRCADGARQRGFVSEWVSRRIAAIYWHRRSRRHAETRRLLAEVEGDLERLRDDRLSGQLAYQRGVFLAELGELRAAEQSLSRAADFADRGTNPSEPALYRSYRAVVLSELGRHHDALAALAGLAAQDDSGLSPSDRLARRSEALWIRLRAGLRGSDDASLAALRADLETLIADRRAAGPDPDLSNELANLAYLEARAGQPARAQAAMAEARALDPAGRSVEAPFLDWLGAHLALEAGELSSAERGFLAMERRAERETPGLRNDYAWRASLGLAQVALARRKLPVAEAFLARARQILQHEARQSGGPEARVHFLADRRDALARAVEALLRAGRRDLAWRLADDGQAWLFRSLEADRSVRLARVEPTSRAAFLAAEERYAADRERFLAESEPPLLSTEERAAWQAERARSAARLAAARDALAEQLDALAPLATATTLDAERLAEDEALLEIFATEHTRVAFWVTRRGVQATADDAWSLLTPERLKTVAHLYVAEGGQGHAVRPLAAEPVAGRPLIEHAGVSFIPYAAWLAEPRPTPGSGVLVLGDSRRDLPAAYAEARWLAEYLGAELLTREQVTLSAVMSRWHRVGALHFAGHGRLSPGAPWEARLELTGGQTLDLELILARRPPLRLAVLSGCDTGATADAPADGVGLAEAFLLGGTSAVLATVREVDDREARAFVQRFYRHGGAEAPSRAYRAAARESERAHEAGWRAFRLLGARER